jgi:quercetin dioxygenase-like cupin family protein
MNDLKINAQHIADLKNAMQQAIDDGEIAKVDAPLEHYFAAGLYGRRIFVPAGTTVVTKVHKVQHIAIALKGTCTVIDQDGKKSIVSAPSVFITEPGTQRAIFCHDDVEWITVHASESNDVQVIEKNVTCDSFEEYNMLIESQRALP